MKKIQSLILALCALCTTAAWAGVPFESAPSADDASAQLYYIYQPGHQEYVKVTNGNILGSTFTGDQFIFVESSDPDLFYIYNKSCGQYIYYTATTASSNVQVTASSVVKLTADKSKANTWRFVQEGTTDCYDIVPGSVTNVTANTQGWNFRGGPNYALNLYDRSDGNGQWQILGEVPVTMRCANKVFSLPGKPFMHKLLANEGQTVTSVDGLPDGLELKTDRPGYKYIYGTAPAAGEYTYKVNLDNGSSMEVGFTVSENLTQPTPFMGVLTWNAFQGNINDNNIKAIADAFETFGLKDLGYNYMCIDDQWASRGRTNGHLTWGTKFTDHAGVVDYVHSKGLKIGIYSDAGSYTCSGAQPGSYGFETTDANDFLDWNFDLLKYDFCNATGGTTAAAAEQAYKAMGDALKAAADAKGKDFLFYMCEWGKRQPWLWGANTGATCWRATDDTRDYWSDTTYKGGVIQVLDIMKNIWAFQGVNRWNDADMLVVGLHGTGYSSNDGGGAGYRAGLTMDEARTNFALWCMFASPLTLSNNITNLDGKPNSLTGKTVTNTYYKEDLAIIRNKELIDLDQDPLGQAGEPIYDTNDYIVFQKDMVDGSIALSITNLSSSTKSISVKFSDLTALQSGQQYKMRDLWQHAYIDVDAESGEHKAYTTADTYTVSVPSHATMVYRIQPYEADDLTWTEPTEPIVTPDPKPEPVPNNGHVYQIQLNGTEFYFTTTEVPDNNTTTYSISATPEEFYLTEVEGVTNGYYITSTNGTKVGHTTKNSWDFSNDQSVWVIENIEGEPTSIFKQNFTKGFGVDKQEEGAGVYTDKTANKWIFVDVTPANLEWVTEAPEVSTIDKPVAYRIHNVGGEDGGVSGHNNYVKFDEAYPGKLQHIGGTEEDREQADEFIIIDAGDEAVYIYDLTVGQYVIWTQDAQGDINWGANSVSACRVELASTPSKSWYLVLDEGGSEFCYDIVPTPSSTNGWSFMGGTDRSWVVLNLEDKTNRNCKWYFECQRPEKGDPTPITDVTRTPASRNQSFDLAGRRVSKIGRGIYVVGGRKVMM